MLIAVLGRSSHDGALSGRQVPRYPHPPGGNQEGPAGSGQTWSSGEVFPRPARGGGADQGDVRRPLRPGFGEEISEYHREGDGCYVFFNCFVVVVCRDQRVIKP